MAVRGVKALPVKGKRVLVRVDFNVPLNPDGSVADDTRLRASLPTIKYLLAQGAAVILLAHLGRPKGKPDPKYTLAPVAAHLAELLGQPVRFASDCIGEPAQREARALQPGQVLLLENVRFHAEEEQNDRGFAAQIAALGDLYVDDAFGAVHRAHASVEALAHLLPSAAGLLLQRELDALGGLLEHPKRPFAAIIGGSKISTKIGVLEQVLPRVDTLILGGAMANTFLKAGGRNVGASLVEDDQLDVARATLEQARRAGKAVLLPSDVVVAERFAADAQHRTVDVDAVPAGWTILDIGPHAVEQIRQALTACATILWNGTLGVAEFPAFAAGTLAVARILAKLTDATTVVGGGDSVAAVQQAGVADNISHVSTGGGAALELLEGRTLPGVAALPQS